MPRRLLALVGSGKGPLLRIEGFVNPQVNIKGLKAGEEVHVWTDGLAYIFNIAGIHKVDVAEWLSVEGKGSSKTLVCIVEEG